MNLSFSYERAQDDLSEINRLFGINRKNEMIVLYGKISDQGREVKKGDDHFETR
jgi:hypothetical protein